MRIIPFTKQGIEDLKKKLELEIAKRPDAVKQLVKGREMGDLSENGLYKAAKQELNDIDREIRYLKSLLLSAKEQAPTDDEKVQIGHKVVVDTQNGKKEFLKALKGIIDPEEKRKVIGAMFIRIFERVPALNRSQ